MAPNEDPLEEELSSLNSDDAIRCLVMSEVCVFIYIVLRVLVCNIKVRSVEYTPDEKMDKTSDDDKVSVV